MAYKAGTYKFRSAAVLLYFELIIVDCVVAAVGTIPVMLPKTIIYASNHNQTFYASNEHLCIQIIFMH